MIRQFLQFLFILIATSHAFGQSKIPNDTLLLGRASTVVDKGIIFETNDGVNNKRLLIEQSSKLLKWDGNDFRMGDASAGLKTYIFNNNDATNPQLAVDFNNDILLYNKNNMTIGDGANNDKSLLFDKGGGTVGFQYDSATGKMLVKDDPTGNFKRFGSGGGGVEGGVNILPNASFEDGVDAGVGWTSLGGASPSHEAFGDFKEGNQFFMRVDFTTGGQIVESAVINKTTSLGVGCSAQIRYKGGDSNIDIIVEDGSNNEIAKATLSARTEWGLTTPLQFPCVSQMKIRFASSADAASIDIDDTYLGSTLGLTDIGQAGIAGSSFFQTTAGCAWVTTSASMAAFNADSDCPGPTITNQDIGDWQTTDSDLPRQTINNLPKGKYKATFYVQIGNTAGSNSAISIADGTTVCEGVRSKDANATDSMLVSCIFTYTSSGNRDFEIFGQRNTGTLSIQNASTVVDGNTRFELIRFPLETQKAFLPTTQEAKEIDFTAFVNTTTGTVTGERLDWINGSASITTAGQAVITFNTNLFVGDAPSCLCVGIKTEDSTNAPIECNISSSNPETTSGVTIITSQANTRSGVLARIICSRNGDDYIAAKFQSVKVPILVGGSIFVPGVDQKRTKKFTLIFGTDANADDRCSASPCEIFLERGGDWINGNVTRSAAGLYQLTTNAVFKANEDVDCYCTATAGGGDVGQCVLGSDNSTGSMLKANGSGVLTFANTSTDNIRTVNASGASIDSRVVFSCYGEE